jgi:acetyl-CoA carboxylase biotin carboxylase subunit
MGRRPVKELRKVLVANRGEIAVRIIRACREMGIATVAVYSEPDRTSLHVQKADEAVCVGPAPALESYMNVDRLIEAARETGADAIHPGYGFLAESAAFAARVTDEKLVWIGPPASVIEKMGSKIASRALMTKAGVSIVPGSSRGSNDPEKVIADAKQIEGPIFVKASAGGGGKGMRLVDDRSQLDSAVRTAIGEAKAAFGDDTVYIEQVIQQPRHIEYQILADRHGNVVHLFERECSIQRRHQKVVEETPSPALSDALRATMGEAAVTAAKAAGYENAGTIEFILDRDDNFYFLEMNTRIQVEHPITEMTTGIDLVKWQLKVAAGEELDFKQEDLHQHGHAIECRIYAEDETKNFMPSCGVIHYLYEPSGPGLRNDSGIYEGWEVSPHYDPVLSKLVAYGEDREDARRRMLRALGEYVVHGVQTSIDMHKRILAHPLFVAGEVDTEFIDTHSDEILHAPEGDVSDEAFIAAALYELLEGGVKYKRGDGGDAGAPSVWHRIGAWEIGGGA